MRIIKRVNVHEAKTHLSRLLAEVEAGAQVIICRAGKEVATLGPAPVEKKRPLFGLFAGEFEIPEGAFDPDPEMERLFYEGDPPPPPLKPGEKI